MTTHIENMVAATEQVAGLYQETTSTDLPLGTGTAPSLVKRIETHLESIKEAIKTANAGKDGANGEDCTTPGLPGDRGFQGPKGDQGPAGDKGEDGVGYPGPTGNPNYGGDCTINTAIDSGLSAPAVTADSDHLKLTIKFPNYKRNA